MKENNLETEDTLQPEYDFTQLRVSNMGEGRKSFGKQVIQLELDVAEMFPTADAVNEALRFLIRVTQEKVFSASE